MLKAMKVFGGAFLCAALVSTAGCDDPKTDAPAPGATTTAAASAKPKASAAASAKPTEAEKPTEAATAGGSLFKYMPKACDMGRVYINAGKLFSGTDVQKNLTTFQEKLLASMGGADAKKGEEIAKVLKDGGFDPGRDLKEMAVCMPSKTDPPVVAIGISESVKDPLQLISTAMEKAGKPKGTIEKDGDVSYLTQAGEEGALAHVAPGVLLAGKDKAALGKLAKGGDGEAEFSAAAKHLVWASIAGGERDPAVDGTLTDGGDKYDMKVSVQMKGPQAEAMKKDPEKFSKEMEGMAQKVAADIEKTPLKALAEHVKAAKFSVDGDKLVVVGAMPKAAITDASKAIADSKPEELMKAL